MVLMCLSLMTDRLASHSYIFFYKVLIQVPGHLLLDYFPVLLICILNMSSLSDIRIVSIFSLSVTCFFHFLNVFWLSLNFDSDKPSFIKLSYCIFL